MRFATETTFADWRATWSHPIGAHRQRNPSEIRSRHNPAAMLLREAYHRMRVAATVLGCVLASEAAASCAGSAQLDRLGTLVAGIAGTEDAAVSRTLFGAVLAYELPPDADVAPQFRSSLGRLRSALEASSGGAPPDRELTRALAGLGAAIDQSGCRPERGPRPAETAEPVAHASTPAWRSGSGAQDPYAFKSFVIFLASICGAAVVGATGYAIYRRFEPRRAPRHHYVAPVTVTHRDGGDRWVANALDISRSGMKLSGGLDITRGMRLTLAHNGLTQTAVVRWSNDFYYGVEFRPPLSRQAIRDLLRRHAQNPNTAQTKTAPA